MPDRLLPRARRSLGRAKRTATRRLLSLRARTPADDLPMPGAALPEPSRFSGRTGPAGLLVPDPVFLLSSVRSGSTLLAMILNSHSQIDAPHEMHLASLEVRPLTPNAAKAISEMALDDVTLANLLWDRLLHLRLAESGKQIVVDKTPNTTLQWRRIATFWPAARPLFLLRHPQRVAESLIRMRPDTSLDDHYQRVTNYARALADARAAMPGGVTVRYEDLTADPERVVRDVCRWLGVDFEPDMLRYGEQQHPGQFKRGLGDWSSTLKTGAVQAAAPVPDPRGVPPQLHEACRLLDYPVVPTMTVRDSS